MTDSGSPAQHGGHHAIDAALGHGAQALFTLSGAHIFPLYDAAVGGVDAVKSAPDTRAAAIHGRLPLIDVRHEQTAVFAAEAVGKLSRVPGFAAVTAGPGVTNAMSAITGAWMNGSPLVVIGGRAPNYRWGSGALQELDHVPLLAPVTKSATTIHDPSLVESGVRSAFELARSAHRGPVFVDIPMDVLFTPSVATAGNSSDETTMNRAISGDIDRAAELLAAASRPVLVIGSDVWAGDAVDAARRFVEAIGIPTIANGMGRGILSPDDPLLVTRARSTAFSDADLVIVAGAPLDFRLGYGTFGSKDGDGQPTTVVHLIDASSHVAHHAAHAVPIIGDIGAALDELTTLVNAERADVDAWARRLSEIAREEWAADEGILTSDASPIHPARIYGELRTRIAEDDVVIGDGGDFVSFAGRFIEPGSPGCWLDPGPFGCLGTGPGYALGTHIARPGSRPWLLMGDGAAGFSLMDVDSLVRHRVPVTMVVGNNSGWGLERHPMRFLYGYDVIADLPPVAYDDVVRALGGAGETVIEAREIGPALDRARQHDGPYLVNVLTDPEIAYPRSTTGI
jgi:acetolactate synthase-1/2/3 large subunit